MSTDTAPVVAHRVIRYCDSRGWRASCCCGWRTTAQTRARREELAHAHELATTLTTTTRKEDHR